MPLVCVNAHGLQTFRAFRRVDYNPLTVRKPLVKRRIVVFKSKSGVLFPHNAKASCFPGIPEVVFFIDKPVRVHDLFAHHLPHKTKGVKIAVLVDVKTGRFSVKVKGTFCSKGSENRVKFGTKTFRILFNFKVSAKTVGVVFSVSVRVTKGKGLHNLHIVVKGNRNFQPQPVQPVLAD